MTLYIHIYLPERCPIDPGVTTALVHALTMCLSFVVIVMFIVCLLVVLFSCCFCVHVSTMRCASLHAKAALISPRRTSPSLRTQGGQSVHRRRLAPTAWPSSHCRQACERLASACSALPRRGPSAGRRGIQTGWEEQACVDARRCLHEAAQMGISIFAEWTGGRPGSEARARAAAPLHCSDRSRADGKGASHKSGP